MQSFEASAFLTLTIAMIVYFAGAALTRRFALLREFNIPEPVTGGIAAALFTFAAYSWGDIEIAFDTAARDWLLVYFFTSIGINASFADLKKGGKPLFLLLGLTVGFMVIQNVVGVTGANLFGLPDGTGVLVGTASLIGGHGTAIAWAPQIEAMHGTTGAMEIGLAAATLGLVLASVIGGPVGRYLVEKYDLNPGPEDLGGGPIVGLSNDPERQEDISQTSLMASLLVLNIAIIIGYIAHDEITDRGINLPLFVPCLITGIILSNTVPHIFPKLRWPARTKALALVSDYSLSIFLTISLMSLQLWTLAGLGGPLLLVLLAQTLVAILFILFILFPVMGGNYSAAVLSAGFAGFTLGSTPTAVANMTAVRKRYGPAPLAFIILPLVAAFFVDLVNVGLIQFFSQF